MAKRPARQAYNRTASLLRLLGQPARLRILLALAEDEACVCHLEARLSYRQAYISQHLMALREAGLVDSRREGRNIYYRLAQADLLALVEQAAELAGVPEAERRTMRTIPAAQGCSCPHCEAARSLVKLEAVRSA